MRTALACALLAGVPALKGDGLGPALVLPPGAEDAGEITVGIMVNRLGDPYLFGNLGLCLDRGGSVTVTQVGFGETLGRLDVDGFTFRPFHRPIDSDGIGLGDPVSMERRGLPANRSVSEVCQPEDSPRVEFAELVVQVSRRTEKSAFGRGVVVTYLSDGVERRLHIPFNIVLCGPRRDLPEECDG
ncbi:hypothetical protein GCM10023193_13620 [Planotetraspora kaengkrachanensis]|uniref:Uncharacterized protein n=1 Tax=Planotetraspora kaengkrachanensis TaxID=575193 RepID=A0A8J3LTF6_9ACTN|nr:hypothetical protein Pka01_10140 [Planotetraspora kaengkrachanensis]